MECSNIRTQIPAYLEGRLSPAEKRSFEAHVQNCHSCKLLYTSYASKIPNQDLKEQTTQDSKKKDKNKRKGFVPRDAQTRKAAWQSKLEAAGVLIPEIDSSPVTVIEDTVKKTNDLKEQLSGEIVDEETINEKVDIPSLKAQSFSNDDDIQREIKETTKPVFPDLAQALMALSPEESFKAEDEIGIIKPEASTGSIEQIPSDEDLNHNQVSPREIDFDSEQVRDLSQIFLFPDQKERPEVEKEREKTPDLPLSESEQYPDWREDPAQYVDIPYIHPVTQAEVRRRVHRSSLEALLFLEKEAQEKKILADRQKIDELPFATVTPFPEEAKAPDLAQWQMPLSQEANPGAVAHLRLQKQWGIEPASELQVKVKHINQELKTLPFKENPRKQAVLYRFTTLLLTILMLLLIWYYFKT